MDTKKLVAEFVGTFTLIFIGAGAGAVSGDLVAVALAHGLVIVALAYAFGDLSGLHINPAVTVGLWAGGKVDSTTAVSYIITQLLGGVAGAAVLAFVLGGTSSGLGATTLAAGVTPVQGLVLETILTFLLVNTIYHTAVSGKAGDMAPVAIGLTLVFCILMGGPLSGASLNPARTLGPALLTGNFANIWLYFIGPPLGGVLAGLLHNYVLRPAGKVSTKGKR